MIPTHMDCTAVWMSCIQVLRSSLELARISINSGFSVPPVMRKKPHSLLATSLTISFWREMTVESWSFGETREDENGGLEEASVGGERRKRKEAVGGSRERGWEKHQGRKMAGWGVGVWDWGNYWCNKNKYSKEGRRWSRVFFNQGGDLRKRK